MILKQEEIQYSLKGPTIFDVVGRGAFLAAIQYLRLNLHLFYPSSNNVTEIVIANLSQPREDLSR